MRGFKDYQRVMVSAIAIECGGVNVVLPADVAGRVERIRRDGGAWVRLDERIDVAGAHPFPADDASGRGNHVLAYPEFCRAIRRTKGGA